MDKTLSDDSQSVSGSESGSENSRPRRLGRGRARCLPSKFSLKLVNPVVVEKLLFNGSSNNIWVFLDTSL